jgi:hypothetical protein
MSIITHAIPILCYILPDIITGKKAPFMVKESFAALANAPSVSVALPVFTHQAPGLRFFGRLRLCFIFRLPRDSFLILIVK